MGGPRVTPDLTPVCRVAAICGATMAPANAGMLDERRHTSDNLGALQAICHGYSRAEFFVDEPAVCDVDLITAAGTAPLKFARTVLDRLGVFSPATLDACSGSTRCAKSPLTAIR
jgi:putative intracellular protease/amidase